MTFEEQLQRLEKDLAEQKKNNANWPLVTPTLLVKSDLLEQLIEGLRGARAEVAARGKLLKHVERVGSSTASGIAMACPFCGHDRPLNADFERFHEEECVAFLPDGTVRTNFR